MLIDKGEKTENKQIFNIDLRKKIVSIYCINAWF